MKRLGVASALVLALSSNVFAQDTAGGTMTVTGTVVSAITLTIEAGVGGFSGGGTAAATSAFGNLSKNGAVPAGTSRANSDTASSYWMTLSVQVSKASSASATYTLSALLGASQPAGTQWALGPGYLSDVTPTLLTATGTCGQTTAYLWMLLIQDTVPNGTPLNNAINFTAVAN